MTLKWVTKNLKCIEGGKQGSKIEKGANVYGL